MAPLIGYRRRPLPESACAAADLHPLLARVYAARGAFDEAAVRPRLQALHPPHLLGGIDAAAALVCDALAREASILIVGDYDCDGATATALAVRGLRHLGARHVDYAVPHRLRHGYGLSPALVDSLQRMPDLLITVDNGIAAHAGVAAARARGARVLVTDHHLPGADLPPADAVLDPNLPGDRFPSKALAGVGVMFYLLLAVRAALRGQGAAAAAEPDLAGLLDLVALGTVADLVPLDGNNRALVRAGLARMRRGYACAGMRALFTISGRDPRVATAADLGYALAPRINAAGRLEDMRIGIECLLSDDAERALALAARLHAINADRRQLQAGMLEAALELLDGPAVARAGIALFHHDWHEGVVGLVASRLKERLHRPVLACAPATGAAGELRGSARSIAGLHVRDVLADIDAAHPGLLLRYGGHAMAAGLSLRARDFERLAELFDQATRARLGPDALDPQLLTDGELGPEEYSLELARALRDGGPWGQNFAEPLFEGRFDCLRWRVVGAGHWRLRLRPLPDGPELDAVQFDPEGPAPPPQLRAAYRLAIDTWQGGERLQLVLQHCMPA